MEVVSFVRVKRSEDMLHNIQHEKAGAALNTIFILFC